MGRLDGKIALITGTGGGQGCAAAILFAREGAKVVGCVLNEQAAAETLKLVRDAGGEMVSMAPVALSTESGAAKWVEEGVAAFGDIDILYNNASTPRFGPFESMPIEDWHFTIRNELDIVYLVTRASSCERRRCWRMPHRSGSRGWYVPRSVWLFQSRSL